ncbi:hypothetical protein P3X46_033533 [Hevea brasiliensis]|uniref:Uncharacterized protein n=1 Tax=Hevea brasiliensis TaxID=3981 RepID=A0ABQ9KE76_HEVBR|nr:uncharacterized protein LOC131177422 [Hevea brasiliensis]KAJ9128619.1 hypothetical protein P3X46_034690 [Hevea brasiliensis]KAJ9132693.1 hypothetical protein P3X46_033533 [Hevea brasiliensis]
METVTAPTKNPKMTDTNNVELNSSFLFHNGFNPSFQISDIEMIAIQPVTYTSLKDLLPVSPPTISSPTHNSSWYEIPIKNPLVKQAALAYLQPMSSPPEVGDKGFFGRLREMCCGEYGCFGWINDVVFKCLRESCWERTDEIEDEDDDDDDKVD